MFEIYKPSRTDFLSLLWENLPVGILNRRLRRGNGSSQAGRRLLLVCRSLHFFLRRGPLFKLLPPSWLTQRRVGKTSCVFFDDSRKTATRTLDQRISQKAKYRIALEGVSESCGLFFFSVSLKRPREQHMLVNRFIFKRTLNARGQDTPSDAMQ